MSNPFASVATKLSLRYIVQYDQYSDFSKKEKIQKVEWSDIAVSKVLGKGSFSNVVLVTVSGGKECERSAGSSSSTCDEDPKEYALKCLDSKALTTEDDFITGARNLAWEASILSKIDHPNIIQLRGVSSGPVSESYSKINGGYFILLDVLDETLTQRFDRLRVVKASQYTVQQRLQDIAISVAQAMTYLHNTKQIILRDLKPDNIGFTASGTLKLFDFGLARALHGKHVRGVAGSYRYTSPEVMMGENNGFPSDVYSFGVLLWEICTMQRPFDAVMRNKRQKDTFQDKVARDGYRPSLNRIACKRTKSIIKDCWEANPDERPPFTRVLLLLSDICNVQSHSSFKSSRLQLSKPPMSSRLSVVKQSPSQITMEKMQITGSRPKSFTSTISQNTASNSSVGGCDDSHSSTPSSPRSSLVVKMTSLRRSLLGGLSSGRPRNTGSTTTLLPRTEVKEDGVSNNTHVSKVPPPGAGTVLLAGAV
jgi:serine/threonine protein kinase